MRNNTTLTLAIVVALSLSCLLIGACGGEEPVDVDSTEAAMKKKPGLLTPCCGQATSTSGRFCGFGDGHGSCCGYATCTDAAVCGSDYGKRLWTCLDCDFYNCNASSPMSRLPVLKPGGLQSKLP